MSIYSYLKYKDLKLLKVNHIALFVARLTGIASGQWLLITRIY